MHPRQQFRISRSVGPLHSLGVEIRSDDAVVKAADPTRLAHGHGGVGEGDADEPLNCSGEPTKRIFLVPRPVMHTRHCAGVKCLHQQGTNTCDERRHASVNSPRCRSDAEKSGVLALFDLADPVRTAARVAGESREESGSKRGGKAGHSHTLSNLSENDGECAAWFGLARSVAVSAETPVIVWPSITWVCGFVARVAHADHRHTRGGTT